MVARWVKWSLLWLTLGLAGCSTLSNTHQQARTMPAQSGIASFYADKFQGRKTASGERYEHDRYSAAHRTFAFGTRVKVTNISSGESVNVVINDRGPFISGRIIDLSKSAFNRISDTSKGVVLVTVEVID